MKGIEPSEKNRQHLSLFIDYKLNIDGEIKLKTVQKIAFQFCVKWLKSFLQLMASPDHPEI